MKYSFFSSLLLATAARTARVNIEQTASPLDVKLASVSDTVVKITLTNTGSAGSAPLNLMTVGTFLDDDEVEAFDVFSAGSTNKAVGKASFMGIRYRVSTEDLVDDEFMTVYAGEKIERTINLASVYDLSAGGRFDIIAQGTFPYAEVGSTEIVGATRYLSNVLSINIDGDLAGMAEKAFSRLDKRSDIKANCANAQLAATNAALANCLKLANAGAKAAEIDPPRRMLQFFKSSSPATRTQVANRFKAIAKECDVAGQAVTTTHCADLVGGCRPGVLAYTIPSRNLVVNCPTFFTLPPMTDRCYRQDQAGTTLHEFTHAPGVMSPSTEDFAYGFAASTSLTASQSLNNADSFALFASGALNNCN